MSCPRPSQLQGAETPVLQLPDHRRGPTVKTVAYTVGVESGLLVDRRPVQVDRVGPRVTADRHLSARQAGVRQIRPVLLTEELCVQTVGRENLGVSEGFAVLERTLPHLYQRTAILGLPVGREVDFDHVDNRLIAPDTVDESQMLWVELEHVRTPARRLFTDEHLPPHLDRLLEGAELDVDDSEFLYRLHVRATGVECTQLLFREVALPVLGVVPHESLELLLETEKLVRIATELVDQSVPPLDHLLQSCRHAIGIQRPFTDAPEEVGLFASNLAQCIVCDNMRRHVTTFQSYRQTSPWPHLSEVGEASFVENGVLRLSY